MRWERHSPRHAAFGTMDRRMCARVPHPLKTNRLALEGDLKMHDAGALPKIPAFRRRSAIMRRAPLRITHGGPGTSFRGRLVALCRCGIGCYSNPCTMMNSGANVSETMVMRLMRMFMDGPDVSLNGSPTVSPTTAALWASEPLPP